MIAYKRVKVPIYEFTLHIILTEDCEQSIEEINKKFPFNPGSYEFSGFSAYQGKHLLILLNGKHIVGEPFMASVVAHESLHTTHYIMKRVGIKSDVDNDEAQAYLLSWVVEQVYNLIIKHR